MAGGSAQRLPSAHQALPIRYNAAKRSSAAERVLTFWVPHQARTVRAPSGRKRLGHWPRSSGNAVRNADLCVSASLFARSRYPQHTRTL